VNRLIVIGASAGGIRALLRLTAELPEALPAAVLIVQHIGAHRSILPEMLGQRCRLPVAHPFDGEPLQAGIVRIAPPDEHMSVDGGRIRLGRGPKEHHARPAIDPLFRSAAVDLGPAVVGVILTGMLDDGTPGLAAIKALGGTTVVQDPADAEFASMPESALRYVEVDHTVPLATMAPLLASLAAEPVAPAPAARREQAEESALDHEQAVALGQGDVVAHLSAIAEPSMFACPECHGGLWKLFDARPERYRCHTGHAYTLRTLQRAMADTSDEASWNAVRALQERTLVLRRMEAVERYNGNIGVAARIAEVREQLERQVDVLRGLVEQAPAPVE
jgi:two-component system chemotaxis response regulator CheB